MRFDPKVPRGREFDFSEDGLQKVGVSLESGGGIRFRC